MEANPINLCVSDDEGADGTDGLVGIAHGAPPNASVALGKRKAEAQPEAQHADANDDSDDCEVTEGPPSRVVRDPDAGSSNVANEDDDVRCIGRSGAFALEDYPHAREDCAVHPFRSGSQHKFCPNCYCYVCDERASACSTWTCGDPPHCKATRILPLYCALRRATQAIVGDTLALAAATASQRGAAAAIAPALPHPVASPAPSYGGAAAASTQDLPSCAEILKNAERVYPVEAPTPQGIRSEVTLKGYQAQSLAFMLDIERTKERTLLGVRYQPGLGPQSSIAGRNQPFTLRGGFLADEVGMGKTLTVISLILANPHHDPKHRARAAGPSVHVRTRTPPEITTGALAPTWDVTVILAPLTILHQWQEELALFAPGLRVVNLHRASQHKAEAIASADVLICTVESIGKWSVLQYQPIHRLVIDEAHLLPSFDSARGIAIRQIGAHNVWMVTATPVRTGPEDLKTSAYILGHVDDGFRLFQTPRTGRFRMRTSPVPFAPSFRMLKRLMIRHTKRMQIGGQVALPLPSLTYETVFLDMGRDEQDMYRTAFMNTESPHTITSFGTLERVLKYPRMAASNVYTEFALRYDVYGKGVRTSKLFGAVDSMRPPHDASLYSMKQVASMCSFTTYYNHGGKHIYGAPRLLVLGYLSDPDKCTKLGALRSDLRLLLDQNSAMRAVVFTHHLVAQLSIVAMLRSEGTVEVFEISGDSKPSERTKALQAFQTNDGLPKVAVLTFRTAAAGINLQIAPRVYFFEPCLDPATEIQAAGRIHRFGQTSQVLIKRFAFRGTVDEKICAMYDPKDRLKHLIDALFPRRA